MDRRVASYKEYDIIVSDHQLLGFVFSPICWDKNEKIIYFKSSIWMKFQDLSKDEREAVLNHEIRERQNFKEGLSIKDAHKDAMSKKMKKIQRKLRMK